jgi:hypothetical protein
MANGFSRNGAACREISAQRHVARHSGNSFNLGEGISPIAPRLFRHTEQCVRPPQGRDLGVGKRMSRYDAAVIPRRAPVYALAPIQRPVKPTP